MENTNFVPKLSHIQKLTRENSVNIVKEKGNYFIKDIGEQITESAKEGNNYIFYRAENKDEYIVEAFEMALSAFEQEGYMVRRYYKDNSPLLNVGIIWTI